MDGWGDRGYVRRRHHDKARRRGVEEMLITPEAQADATLAACHMERQVRRLDTEGTEMATPYCLVPVLGSVLKMENDQGQRGRGSGNHLGDARISRARTIGLLAAAEPLRVVRDEHGQDRKIGCAESLVSTITHGRFGDAQRPTPRNEAVRLDGTIKRRRLE